MYYLKTLFFNFLIVFFSNYILPGIQVINPTKLPHLGGDLPFALGLGFLNSLIYPLLKLLGKQASIIQIASFALVLNFLVYGLLKWITAIGIAVETVEGYIIASLVVAIGSFVMNFLEMKHKVSHHKQDVNISKPDSFNLQ